MPPAAPLLIAGAMAAASSAIAGATLAGIAASFVISAALSGVGMLLQKPASSNAGPVGGVGGGSAFPALDSGSKVTVRSAAQPRLVVYGRTRVNGNIVFAQARGDNRYLDLVIALADHESAAIEEVYFGDELVSSADGTIIAKYIANVGISRHLGTAEQAADATLIAYAAGTWTSNHRLCGVTYIYVSLVWDRTLFPAGLPDIWAVVKGKKVFDPRDGTTAWSDNAALCVADELASARHGLGATYGEEIDNTVLAASASVCDELVDLAAGGTEKRYALNGSFRTDQKPIDVIASMLGSMAGRVVFAGGKWKVQAGAWSVPVLSFDEDDLRAGFTVQNLLGRRESFNAVKGTYSSPAKLWQPDDFPAVSPAAYRAADGEQTFKDIQLPFTSSAATAQRIARIDIRRARQTLTMVWPCKLTAWRAQVGDVVSISNTRLGWSGKAFEVVNVALVFEGGSSGGGATPVLVGVDLKLRETDATIFDWSATDESAVDVAPNTTLPDTFNVKPASNLRATESLYSTRDGGGVKAKWSLAWDASPDAFVTSGGFYRPQYRLAGASTWTSLPETTALAAEVTDIDPGTYEARVFAVNWAGAPSPAVLLMPTVVAGLSAAPAAPAGFTVNAAGGLAIARWTLPAELDVLQGGYIVFRHSSLTTGATWDTAVSIADPMSGNLSAAVLPLKSGTYLAKFVDASGNYSESFALFVQTQASVLSFSTLGSLVEDPAFAGTKTACSVADSLLVLDAAGDFDDVPDTDALVAWDWFGGVVSAGSYAFSAPLDLATVRRCRVTGTIAAQVLNIFDDVDSREGDVDEWASWDGPVTGNECDARLMVQATVDNPASGAAAWSAWQRLDAADFNARGFRFRLDLASNDPSFTIKVSSLNAVAEVI